MNQERENPKRESPEKGRGWMIAAGLCAFCFLICVIWLVIYTGNNRRAEEDLADLRQSYTASISGEAQNAEESEIAHKPIAETTPAPTAVPSSLLAYDIPDKVVDVAALRENENEDIYAWITVPGTAIDYPVLQHPTELDYYLNHNVDRSGGYPGCIYSQYLNSTDWADPNTVLYGHNMKNGSMFAGLHYYEDPDFLETNQYVYIFTQGYVRVYHIFGAYEYDNRHILLTADMDNPDIFAAYLQDIAGLNGMRDNFLEEVSVTPEDKLLTLETCITGKPDRRYIVQAVLEAEGEWPLEDAG